MSTRAVIGVYTDKANEQWRATYHHWDGYPSGLGAALWKIYHQHYEGVLHTMVEYLIDANPCGWSTIVGCDFSLPPAWFDSDEWLRYSKLNKPFPPQSYKVRGEDPDPLDETSDRAQEWAYVFDLRAETMTILKCNGWGSGMHYVHIVTVPLEGTVEPDWRQLEA